MNNYENINYEEYKPYLHRYLSQSGIALPNQKNPLIKCFSPDHADSTPSCQVFQDSFKCYACGIHGDIYDAVRILEGITKPYEQHKHLQELFGGSANLNLLPKVEYKKEEIKYPTEEETQKFEDYLKSITNEKAITTFFNTRANFSSHDKVNFYPVNIAKKCEGKIFWWNGLNEARQVLGDDLLKAVNIPFPKDGKNFSSWSKSGLVIKLGTGYKLHYYSFNEEEEKWKCLKRGNSHCRTFPTPCQNLPKSIILVEGELDAIVCQSAEFENVFSTGGTQGLTKEIVEKYILGKVEEITFLYDNDKAGKEATLDRSKFLVKNGFTGTIKHAKTEELAPSKDPDEAILWGYADKVKKAIENAVIFGEEKKEEKTNVKVQLRNVELLSKRSVTTILSQVKYETLTKQQIKDFSQALINVANVEFTKAKLQSWGLKDIPNQNEDKNYQIIIDLVKTNGFSRKTIYNYEKALNIKSSISGEYLDHKSIVKVDITSIKDSKDFKTLMFAKNPAKEATNILEFFLQDQLIYEKESDKFYFFDGLVWNFRPDVTDIAYYILRDCVNQFYKGDETSVNECFNRLGGYDFCRKTMKSLSEKPSIFREHIFFDSEIIKETLTLQDTVLDFSKGKIDFRKAYPQEYRQDKLPYTRKEIEKAENKTPENFLKFMNSNFDNKDTLKSLLYYLSTIPSRSVTFKVGGIFTGITGTGKTTTIELLSKIYPNMIVPIPRSFIMQSRYGNDDSGASPFLVELEGKGAGVSDETEKNDKLNSTEFKKLTSIGVRTARQLYSKPHKFVQTAQTIICTNYAPLFDSTDSAVVERMFIIQFSKQHKKGEAGTLEFDDLMKSIENEKPQIVRYFAEKYIDLKTVFKSKIPDSEECKAYKADYIERMDENGLQGFVLKYITFEKGSGKYIPLKEVYRRYCHYMNIELDETGKPVDTDKLTQAKFTRYLKRDYNEFKVKQMRINGYPEQVVVDLVVKEWNEVPEDEIKTEPVPQVQQPQQIEEENPFAGMRPAPANWNK